MEIHTRKIEEAFIKKMCIDFSPQSTKPKIVLLSTGAGLMMSCASILNEKFNVNCIDLNGTIEDRIEKIHIFSQFKTPCIIILWLSLAPSSIYFDLIQRFGTKPINTKIYLKGLVNNSSKDWTDLGYELVGGLEDLTNLKFQKHV